MRFFGQILSNFKWRFTLNRLNGKCLVWFFLFLNVFPKYIIIMEDFNRASLRNTKHLQRLSLMILVDVCLYYECFQSLKVTIATLEAILDLGLSLVTLLVFVVKTFVCCYIRTRLTTEEFSLEAATSIVVPLTATPSGYTLKMFLKFEIEPIH